MSHSKVILSADSSCDLGPELKNKYKVNYLRFHINLNDRSYLDGVDITSKDIFSIYRQKKCLPKTASIGVGEYYEMFKKWTSQGFEVIHINLSSAISSAYQNCCTAAGELNGVYPIDSRNLSTGMGLLIIEAAKRIEQGLSGYEIQNEVKLLTDKVQTSFIIDTLKFLYAGGRCSMLAALGANLLKIKPCISVDNILGTMSVVKKYRGTFEKAAENYMFDTFKNLDKINPENMFITHSLESAELVEKIYNYINNLNYFRNIYITETGCTISSHCGTNTLGLVCMNK